MASRTLPGSLGLTAEWALGEDLWKEGMDVNLFLLSIVGQLVVKSMVASEPGSPAEGDVHIITVSNQIAIYDQAEWRNIDAQEGWIAYNLDDDTLYVLKDAVWTVLTGGGGASGLPTGGDPGQVLVKAGGSDYDAEWDDLTAPPGESAEFRVADGYLQWKLPSEEDWTNLISTEELANFPEAPEDGKHYARVNGDWAAITESIIIAVSDETTTIEAGVAKVTFRMPYAFALSAVRASLSGASGAGDVVVDINESGATILSTKLSIDSGEKTSVTAATAAVISDASLANDAEITIDIDSAGSGAKGLKVTLIGQRVA